MRFFQIIIQIPTFILYEIISSVISSEKDTEKEIEFKNSNHFWSKISE